MTIHVLAYDATPIAGKPLGVERMWARGAKLFAPRFDVVIRATDWEQVLSEMETLRMQRGAHERIELQVWGHGAPGVPLIGGAGAPEGDRRWGAVDLVWFRSCSVSRTASGRDFMKAIAAHGCDVAAHMVVIGPWGAQSCLYGLRAGAEPWWVNQDEVQTYIDLGTSRPWYPRTVMFWHMRCPDWAFRPSRKLLTA